jgi:heptaprenyl diphosphate synthase
MNTLPLPHLSPDLARRLGDGMERVESMLREHPKSEYPFITETSGHLVAAGGKRLRPLLTLLAAECGAGINDEVIKAAVVCELTHLATLYHDDVMDEAPLRRGVDSANQRWGNTIAILTGDFLFAKASELLADLGPEAVRLQARTFERLVTGQILETVGPDEGGDRLSHYLHVVAEKTGSLIATSARFGALFSGASPATAETLTEFGERIGVAFQLADDLIDVASDSGVSGKTPGTDLREGVPTLVTLHVLTSSDPDDQQLQTVLSSPINDEAAVADVLNQLRTHPALNRAREDLHRYADGARSALASLDNSDAKEALLALCDAVVERSA